MAKKRKILIKNNGKNGSFTIRVNKITRRNENSLSEVVTRVVSRSQKRKESTQAA